MKRYALIPLPQVKDLKNGETKSNLFKTIYGYDLTFDSALPQDWVDKLVAKIRGDYGLTKKFRENAYDVVVSQICWAYPKEGEGHILGLPLPVTREAHLVLYRHDTHNK